MSEILHVFLEGDDDERFIKRIIYPLLINRHAIVKIIKYSREEIIKINKYVHTINQVESWDYVFLTDIDLVTCIANKKQYIGEKYSSLDPSKIIIVVKEIEGWYLAGINDKFRRSVKIKGFRETNGLTKESFRALIPRKYTRLQFLLELLEYYSLPMAIEKNRSLLYFYNKYLGNMNPAMVDAEI
jgi:hypothetical protein